jgi:glyceraldehyde 3-phosphate dehydrogenase
MNIGINGLGRIGRLVIRDFFGGTNRKFNTSNLSIFHLNDPHCNADNLCHLLKYDSVHGIWDALIKTLGHDRISINGSEIKLTNFINPSDVNWSDSNCNVVLDCTGKFLSKEKLQGYFNSDIKKVIVSAPINDPEILNIVFGVNDHLYDSSKYNIITAASCTTNCLAPIVSVVHKNLEILKGQITTIHNPTNTNVLLDKPHKDLRRARSTMLSMHPTSTGSAKAIGLIFPELKGKLDGHAVRVPVINSSLTDCVFQLNKKTTINEVNELFEQASKSDLKGILGIEFNPLVSIDFLNDTRSSIVDANSTLITDNNLLKVYSWYDNETGYACRMNDLAEMVCKSLNV